MNYYETLQIERTADDATIKASYRKLAMKYHPDRNGGSKSAEAKFKAVGEAYDCLKNPQKRAAYDRYGSAAFGGYEEPRPYRRPYEAPRRHVRYRLEVTMAEAEWGAHATLPNGRFVSFDPGLRDGDEIEIDAWTTVVIESDNVWSHDRTSRVYQRKGDDLYITYEIEKYADQRRGKEVTIYDHPGWHMAKFTLNTKIKDGALWKVKGGGMKKHPQRRRFKGERGDLYVRFVGPKNLWQRRNDMSTWSGEEQLLVSVVGAFGLVGVVIGVAVLISMIP